MSPSDEDAISESAGRAGPSHATEVGASPPADMARKLEFTIFYHQETARLVAFLRVQGASLVEAADFAQDAMVEAFRRWDGIEAPRAWVRVVASRMFIRGRSSLNHEVLTGREEEPPLLLKSLPDVSAWEQRHDLLRLLEELPPHQRQVLAWTFDGYAPSEIGHALGKTPESVRSSLLKARRRVILLLEAERGRDHE